MKRTKPGQVRVRRDFLKAGSLEELWPEGVRVGEFRQLEKNEWIVPQRKS